LTHQGLVAARAQRQREGIEQARLSGAGLAGQHSEPLGKIDVEPVDQDDVADRESGEHGAAVPGLRPARSCAGHPRLADSWPLKTWMAREVEPCPASTPLSRRTSVKPRLAVT